MNLSYWERKSWFTDIDFAIIGSGIVGLSCALSLRKKYPKHKIVVFEKGMLPSGASTKNAGFACFGSLSEILDDLKTHSEKEVVSLVKKRMDGLRLLRNTLGDANLEYQENGGYELFTKENEDLFEACYHQMSYVNDLLKPVFKDTIFSVSANNFGFGNVHPKLIFNQFEGQIDTGKMMLGLVKKASEASILIVNAAEITSLSEEEKEVRFRLNHSEEISAKNILIATNGFAKQLLKEDVQPARAQVLITKPIKNLHIKGTFHLDKGYYYFRNIDNRILFGGGRNLDFKSEETTKTGLTTIVQDRLEEILRTTILPNTPFEIDHRWSGIMGVGQQKKPIVKQLSERIYCGVRLGGMGVAIGSSIGDELAKLTWKT
ncbi:NAD(P)/FAD-dependent oxidoreductase [Ulvibacter antarcticus]|uniref:Glycine/D-amino acid oxidase-like deaminating enzyme n=1 Tax=Ulvibacter antarcticus TaxID=442714 RepID=A0A3L9Z0L7_9FLAO|nr:FAD-dependent oxidoreductase [Ulvibacter antarcticus]RMA66054.1 glycine/D-amino acid oxidase-like deaminating enzyme [Ulvibacter antarcticus]